MVHVRLFASLRDLVGNAQIQLDFDGETTARAVFNQLQLSFPDLKRYEPITLITINQEFSSWEGRVAPGDEVAFFPPVSGGQA